MQNLITILTKSFRNKREMRQALPIAARIIQTRISAQESGRDCEVEYSEIANESVKLVRAIRKEIYSNGGTKGTN